MRTNSMAMMMAMTLLFSACTTACTKTASSGASGTPTPVATTPDPTPTPTSTPQSSCSTRAPICTGWNVREACAPDGVTWASETCSGGCFAGACSANACADECALGGACQLWQMSTSSFIPADPAGSMHDRARDDDARLFVENLPNGAVANTHWTDPSRSAVSFYSDLGDSALWTGSTLAAEAWRYQATGAPAAADRMKLLVATLHRNFSITADSGYLARYSAPAGAPNVPELEGSCGLTDHCGVGFEGANWSWIGHTSRDQYTGVMLGLFAAYEASHDETLRATIRHDVVAVARELSTVRIAVPAHVDLGGFPIDTTMDLENVILAPNETADGKVWLTVDTGNFSNTDLYGAREFLPDVSTALKQIPGFSWLPPIKRASSSIMLGAFMRMGLEMTDGVPGSEADHAELLAYYDAHADSWLSDAETWSFSTNCGNAYYATHIAYISAYVWASLEDDPARGTRIRDHVLDAKMWSALNGHRNSYFAFLWGGTRATPDASQIAAAVADLSGYPAGPRVNLAQNHVADYPDSTSCTENGQPQSTVAVSVADRQADDFIWQRHPWGLFTSGDVSQTFSGADYLAAYWAARRYSFTPDDHQGTCARWQ